MKNVTSMRISVIAALAALVVLATLAPSGGQAAAEEAGSTARVDANGRCLNLRHSPSLDAEPPLTCIPDGSFVTLLSDEVVEAEGHRWREVDASLHQGWVSEDFLVFVDGEEPGEETPAPSTDGMATITYYYCEQGENELAWGDGGGFCETLRSGESVYQGAAACSVENFGQRFRIVGDPLDLVYTCEDTGSAVRGDHRDIWFENSDDGFDWLAEVGHQAEIVIVDEVGEPLTAPTGEFSPEPVAGGLTMALFDGSLEQLDEAGSELSLVSCFATVDGAFVGYAFGAPAFLNEVFVDEFATGLSGRPLVCRRG